MNASLRISKKLTTIIVLAMALLIIAFAGSFTQYASAEDYTFENVPIESIEIAVVDDISSVQPRQEFSLTYDVSPWYTTASEIYFEIMPSNAAVVKEVSKIELKDGKAQGAAIISVANDAAVGSTFEVYASIGEVESNKIEMSVAKIPVTAIELSLQGSDDKLHIGKSRTLNCQFFPSYASNQDLRYELSGSGVKYIENFDESSATINAKKNVAFIDVNSTVTVTAYSIDNPNAFDSITLTLYMPTTVVELSANTPLGGVNKDGDALAVASSVASDIVTLSAKVNGVDSTGLNYIIIKGQEYVEDGYVHSDGTFELRKTSNWSDSMKVPHPEIKIRASYSDGFDEITISVYVPVEKITFVNTISTDVENFRSYDMQAQAFPEYATLLADNDTPIYYMLEGADSSIASIDADGLLSLPKSLTSKGSVIAYSANLTNAWEGVDVAPLTQALTVVPVYAEAFKSVKITKNGKEIDDINVKALPSDVLAVEPEYAIDNVTDVDITLSHSSDVLSTTANIINVAALSKMHENRPFIKVTANYSHGGKEFSNDCYLFIYVPALSAEIEDSTFHRDEILDLNVLLTINGHGYATNKIIEWGAPTVTNGAAGIVAECDDGLLNISSQANAGTIVKVPYRTYDSGVWQYKEFTVAPLNGVFNVEYGKIFSDKDNRSYDMDYVAPQLEEGQNVDMYLTYKGMGGKTIYGLGYSIEVSTDNATLVYKGGDKSKDTFMLAAKSGQSGRDNYITYKITVFDGDATYYVITDGSSLPNNVTNVAISPKIAIFKRINSTLGVSEVSVEAGDNFTLTGWNSSFTYNQKDLVWNLSGGKMISNTIQSAPNNGFVLKITANQKYNNQDIPYSAEITFSAIIYKYENANGNIETVKKVYKKQGYSVALEGQICTKADNVQTGWSNSQNGGKDYTFAQTYAGNSDKTLYAYWVRINNKIKITQEITVDENQKVNSYTAYKDIGFSIKELKELGYKEFSVDFAYALKKVKQDGDCAKIWLELNGKDAFVRDKFSVSSDKVTYHSRFNLNIDSFTDSSQIRVGLFAYGDWKIGKYTFTFYETEITFKAEK